MKKVTVTVAVVAMVFAISACGGSDSDSSSSESGTTANLRLAWQTGSEDPVKALVADFQKANPDVKVTPQFYPIDTYGQVMQTQFRGGNGPDLVWGSPGTGNPNGLGVLAEQDYLLDLSKEPFADDVPKDTSLWVGDRLDGIPVGAFPIGMLTNTDALEAIGGKVPTNLPELLEMCQAAKAEGKAAVNLPGAATAGAGLFGASLASAIVYGPHPDWSAQRDAKEVTFANTPEWRTVFERVQELNDAECFPEGAAGLQIPQAIAALGEGKTVTGLLPGDVIGFVEGPKLAMYPFPTGDDASSTLVPISFGQGLGVNAKSENLDAAKEFIAFAAQPEAQDKLANAYGVPSVGQYQEGTLTKPLAGLTDAVKAKKTRPYAAISFPNPAVLTALGKGVTGLVTGQMNIDQALADLDKAWDTGSA